MGIHAAGPIVIPLGYLFWLLVDSLLYGTCGVCYRTPQYAPDGTLVLKRVASAEGEGEGGGKNKTASRGEGSSPLAAFAWRNGLAQGCTLKPEPQYEISDSQY